MIRPLLAVLGTVLAALVVSAPLPSAGAEEPKPRDVSDALEKIRAEHDVPGLVALRLDGDRIVAQGAAGVRRRGEKDALTVGDRMHLGSCTKAMTATLCAALVAEGKLRWEDEVAAVLKDAVDADSAWKGATLEKLLRNRGGAPADLDAGGLWARLCRHAGPPRAARLALAKGVLAAKPAATPGGTYIYSNAGFSLAGAMAERAADRPFEDLLRARVLDPLGMKSAGFGPPAAADGVSPAVGHDERGAPALGDNPDAIAPAGKVHASLADWGKFVTLHLRRGRAAPAALAKIDFERLHTPEGDYAMGWGVAERDWARGKAKGDRGRVLHHAGSNTMWFAVAWLAPERDLAVLAACNQGGDAAARACDAAVGTLLR